MNQCQSHWLYVFTKERTHNTIVFLLDCFLSIVMLFWSPNYKQEISPIENIHWHFTVKRTEYHRYIVTLGGGKSQNRTGPIFFCQKFVKFSAFGAINSVSRTFLCWWWWIGCGWWRSRDAASDTRPSSHASAGSTEDRWSCRLVRSEDETAASRLRSHARKCLSARSSKYRKAVTRNQASPHPPGTMHTGRI